MSSRRKSSTPCMVRPGSGPPERPRPAEAGPREEEEPAEDQAPQHQEEVWGPGPEGRPSSLDNHEALEQKRAGPEAEAPEMDPEEDEEEDEEEEEEEGDSKTSSQQPQSRGYVCKYCSFSTHNLCDFKAHVDGVHPGVKLHPLYRCAACSFSTGRLHALTDHNEARHPGETRFKFRRVTVDRQTVLEQTIEGPGAPAALQRPGGVRTLYEDPTPNGFLKRDQGPADINGALIVPEPAALQGPQGTPLLQGPQVSPLLQGPQVSPLLQGSQVSPLLQGSQVSPLLQGPQVTPLLQGPQVSPLLQGSQVSLLLQGPQVTPLLQGSHVTPLLQRPPNFSAVPKIAVPLNTTKYNPSLDSNQTLMSSFSRFPYPTHAELSWLTAASKHPEEQIKVWFTTQRLKQGITWSPEEVEEARKKMFNGSIPPAHHTFSAPPAGPVSPQPGPRPRPSSSPPGRVSLCSSYAVVRPLGEQAESRRPVMAVAPHSGDPKDKGLMAPPPPPPPLKDRPPVTMEMKRPAATPLVTADPKRKHLGGASMAPPSSKDQPAGSRPPMLLPQSLGRRYIAPPPPIIAPPYKNYGIPHPSSLTSQEKHPIITHALLAPDPRPAGPPARRPSIIQPPRAARHPASSSSHRLKEQQGMELRNPSPRADKVLTPLAEANGVPRDPNPPPPAALQGGGGGRGPALHKGPVPSQFPLLERMKGKTAAQLKALEETFLRNSFPSHADVDALAAAARLSRHEVRSWFLERRALRDNLEQALLNSMGSKKTGGPPGADRRQQHQTPQLNGSHKPRSGGGGGGGGHIRSPPPPPSQAPPPIVAPPTPDPPPAAGLPDGRAPALLKEDWALGRWPSPEEMGQLEARTGLPPCDLLRWFSDSRLTLKASGAELTQLFHRMGGAGPIGGQQGGRGNPPRENAPNVVQRCREGVAMSNGIDAPEANASRIAENYASSLGSQQHQELQDWFSSRLRQQSSLELKGGGAGEVLGSWTGNGLELKRGGAGEVLGSWTGNGLELRGLPLEHQQKLEG